MSKETVLEDDMPKKKGTSFPPIINTPPPSNIKLSSQSAPTSTVLEDLLDKLGKHFEPATSTRGQGGLPLHGSVRDWKLTITKEGWEHYKQELAADIKAWALAEGLGCLPSREPVHTNLKIEPDNVEDAYKLGVNNGVYQAIDRATANLNNSMGDYVITCCNNYPLGVTCEMANQELDKSKNLKLITPVIYAIIEWTVDTVKLLNNVVVGIGKPL